MGRHTPDPGKAGRDHARTVQDNRAATKAEAARQAAKIRVQSERGDR